MYLLGSTGNLDPAPVHDQRKGYSGRGELIGDILSEIFSVHLYSRHPVYGVHTVFLGRCDHELFPDGHPVKSVLGMDYETLARKRYSHDPILHYDLIRKDIRVLKTSIVSGEPSGDNDIRIDGLHSFQ